MRARFDLKQLERNIRQETLQDGLLELFMGFLFITASGMLDEGRNLIPFLLFLLFGTPVVRILKRKITDPRIGYVELPEGIAPTKTTSRLYVGLGIVIFILFLAVLIVSGDIRYASHWYRWMPLPFGLAMGLVLFALGYWSGLVRYYLMAAFAIITGPVFTFIPFSRKLEGLSMACLALGLVSLLTGLVLLIIFILRHPILPKTGQEHPSDVQHPS